jgi:hypothetical protein
VTGRKGGALSCHSAVLGNRIFDLGYQWREASYLFKLVVMNWFVFSDYFQEALWSLWHAGSQAGLECLCILKNIPPGLAPGSGAAGPRVCHCSSLLLPKPTCRPSKPRCGPTHVLQKLNNSNLPVHVYECACVCLQTFNKYWTHVPGTRDTKGTKQEFCFVLKETLLDINDKKKKKKKPLCLKPDSPTFYHQPCFSILAGWHWLTLYSLCRLPKELA